MDSQYISLNQVSHKTGLGYEQLQYLIKDGFLPQEITHNDYPVFNKSDFLNKLDINEDQFRRMRVTKGNQWSKEILLPPYRIKVKF